MIQDDDEKPVICTEGLENVLVNRPSPLNQEVKLMKPKTQARCKLSSISTRQKKSKFREDSDDHINAKAFTLKNASVLELGEYFRLHCDLPSIADKIVSEGIDGTTFSSLTYEELTSEAGLGFRPLQLKQVVRRLQENASDVPPTRLEVSSQRFGNLLQDKNLVDWTTKDLSNFVRVDCELISAADIISCNGVDGEIFSSLSYEELTGEAGLGLRPLQVKRIRKELGRIWPSINPNPEVKSIRRCGCLLA